MSSAQRWRLWLGAALATGLLAFFFRGIDKDALGTALRSAHLGYLLLVVLASIVVYGLRAWRWGYLLSPIARAPFVDLFSATVVGFMSGLLVPRAGEIVRPFLVSRRHAVTTSAGFATIILERLLDLITVLLLFASYLYAVPPAAAAAGPLMDVVKTGGILAGLGALTALFLLLAVHARAEQVFGLIDRGLGLLPSWLSAPLGRMLRAFGGGLAVMQAPLPHLLAILGQSLLVWLVIALGIHWNNLAFDLALPFPTTFLILAFLTVGVAIPTPGMVGGFHGFYILALVGMFGVAQGVAGAAAITSHALTNLPVLLLGLGFLSREGLTFGRVAQLTEAERP